MGHLSYGIINLTIRQEPYIHFDRIKSKYYSIRKTLYKHILNSESSQNCGNDELMYISPDCPSGIPIMLEKFAWSLQRLLNDDDWAKCDYIIRTNSSTFLNLELLERHLEKLPKWRCYAGPIVNGRFISGTCIILSRDLARYIMKKKIGSEKMTHDDVAISRYMDRRFVRMRDIPMHHFVDNTIPDDSILRGILDRFPLVRVKNNDDRMVYDTAIWDRIAAIKHIDQIKGII